jgi:electron transfer flavoprotein alpha subunit
VTKSIQQLPEYAAAIVASHAKEGKYTHVVTANSVFSRGAVIRSAALNGHQPISDVTSMESEEVKGPNVSSCIEI